MGNRKCSVCFTVDLDYNPDSYSVDLDIGDDLALEDLDLVSASVGRMLYMLMHGMLEDNVTQYLRGMARVERLPEEAKKMCESILKTYEISAKMDNSKCISPLEVLNFSDSDLFSEDQ